MINDTGGSGPSRREQFGSVADAVRYNLSLAVDLVMVHNERPVDGSQPRVALNLSVVLAAVSAWERFIVDAASVFTGGRTRNRELAQYAGPASKLLVESAAIEAEFLSRLVVNASANWSGIRLREMEELDGNVPGRWSGLTFAQHLNQWVTLRNAIAHHDFPRLITRASSPDNWGDPRIGDPYKSQLGGRYLLWEVEHVRRDPESGKKLSFTEVGRHAGCARGCLATIIQVVDWLIADIGQAYGRAWDTSDIRLPDAWFQRNLPPKFRGGDHANYENWTLWGGPALYRHA